MCGRIAYILLGALFTFVVATIAAFTYLEWWQAILVSMLTFMVVVRVTKWIITKFVIGRISDFAQGIFQTKSQVLKGASVDVHLVAPSEPPSDLELYDDDDEPIEMDPQLRWYNIELTIFPESDSEGPMTHWDVDDLVLVPITNDVNEDGGPDETNMVELYGTQLIEDGRAIDFDDSKLNGPQRLRFRIAVPPMVDVLKFRYYMEEFGRIELPHRAMLR